MALTMDSHPSANITNDPQFDVLTSLTEGASYQNLRIRATIYIGGQSASVAVIEQPKGLPSFELFDILDSFTGKCNVDAGGLLQHVQPNMGSELLTGWDNYYTTWDAWSTSGRKIITAYDPASGQALSNDLGTMAPGNIFVVACEADYLDTTGGDMSLKLTDRSHSVTYAETNYSGLLSGKLQANHVYFLMAHDTITNPAVMWHGTGIVTGSGTFSIHKISNYRNNPGVYFHVKFEEVYENASNVTTIGAEEWSDTMLFLPVKVRPDEVFGVDYVINTTGGKFMSRVEDGDVLYKFGIGMEVRVMYACYSAYIKAVVVTDGGSNELDDIPNAGWGMFIIGDDSVVTYPITATDETIDISLVSARPGLSDAYTGAVASIPCELNCFSDFRAISFVGDLGEETLLFRGLHTLSGQAEKTYYKSSNRLRKVLKSYRLFRHKLRTLYETDGVRKLLHELIYSDRDVWMYDTDFTIGYRDVTVVDDDIVISDKDELLQSSIDVEYYE